MVFESSASDDHTIHSTRHRVSHPVSGTSVAPAPTCEPVLRNPIYATVATSTLDQRPQTCL